MEKSVLVLIVAPLMGHLTQSIQMAKIMLEKNNQLSFTVLIMKLPIDPEGTKRIESFIAGCDVERIYFHCLPVPEDTMNWKISNKGLFLNQLVEFQKPHVREIVSRIKGLSGFILDMTTPTMIDVADEFGVPSYVFITSGAAFLGLMFHFQTLQDEHNEEISEFLQKNDEIIAPSFVNPIPVSVLPTITTNYEQWSKRMLKFARGYRKAKGIIVNTFTELEDFALNSFLKDSIYGKFKIPQIYPVGPILNRFQTEAKNHLEIMKWLDNQPVSSVVFVCFGSLGSFNNIDQVKEIALGLERSGHRFLWVLRQPSSTKGGFPSEYKNHELVLPKGFLDRTASIGKVVGWVQQLDVLSHSSVGGFVSHCGWNSILESIWYGVSIATWPLGGEQQLNAFQLVKELKMAVEISLDYNEGNEDQEIVRSEKIEKGIRELMNGENEVRKRVKDFSEKSKLAMKEGGSSHFMFQKLMESIWNNQQHSESLKL